MNAPGGDKQRRERCAGKVSARRANAITQQASPRRDSGRARSIFGDAARAQRAARAQKRAAVRRMRRSISGAHHRAGCRCITRRQQHHIAPRAARCLMRASPLRSITSWKTPQASAQAQRTAASLLACMRHRDIAQNNQALSRAKRHGGGRTNAAARRAFGARTCGNIIGHRRGVAARRAHKRRLAASRINGAETTRKAARQRAAGLSTRLSRRCILPARSGGGSASARNRRRCGAQPRHIMLPRLKHRAQRICAYQGARVFAYARRASGENRRERA